MDLIGSIKYIENRFGGRKRNPNKDKAAPKITRNNVVNEKNTQSEAYPSPAEYDVRLGRTVNITV